MKPVFSTIYDLLKNAETNRIEDFLTELISPIFHSEERLTSFINVVLGQSYNGIKNINVFTQKTYIKLPTHTVDSRPDLVITFSKHKEKHIIFLENKVDSQEGNDQLKRYADHLKEHQNKGYFVHLVYVTKHYEPKDNFPSLNKQHGSGFTQKRWYEIYFWLNQYKSDLYCKLVIEYMEEIKLNKTRKFSPVDIYAIQNARRLQSMLDEALDGKVTKKFTEIFGKPKQWSHRTTRLRDENLYVIINDQSDWKFIGCGFEFTENEYPNLTVYIEVHPNCGKKQDTIRAIEQFCDNKDEWMFQPPSNDNEYFWAYIEKSLAHFLTTDDHIKSIQEYLISKLEELKQLKESNSHLKWLSTP